MIAVWGGVESNCEKLPELALLTEVFPVVSYDFQCKGKLQKKQYVGELDGGMPETQISLWSYECGSNGGRKYGELP